MLMISGFIIFKAEIVIPVFESQWSVEFANYFAPELEHLEPLAEEGLIELF